MLCVPSALCICLEKIRPRKARARSSRSRRARPSGGAAALQQRGLARRWLGAGLERNSRSRRSVGRPPAPTARVRPVDLVAQSKWCWLTACSSSTSTPTSVSGHHGMQSCPSASPAVGPSSAALGAPSTPAWSRARRRDTGRPPPLFAPQAGGRRALARFFRTRRLRVRTAERMGREDTAGSRRRRTRGRSLGRADRGSFYPSSTGTGSGIVHAPAALPARPHRRSVGRPAGARSASILTRYSARGEHAHFVKRQTRWVAM